MKNYMINPRRYSQGLTLVELLIAVVLSIVLLGGTIAIFLSSKQAYKTQEDLARIQENLRYGVTQFTKEASGAGFMGCVASAYKANSKVTSTVASADYENLVNGEEGTGVNSTDKLTLHFALPGTGIPVVDAMKKGAGQTSDKEGAVKVDADHPNYVDSGGNYLLKKHDVIAVSDCDAVAVFKITNNPGSSGELEHDGTGNTETGIQHVFGDGRRASAMVYRLDSVTFEVDKETKNGMTVSSLYATRFGGSRQLVLAGIQDFQVNYGLDLSPRDGTADQYLAWDKISADKINEITSIHIELTVNPGMPVKDASGINNEFKKSAEFTIKLRNRNGDV